MNGRHCKLASQSKICISREMSTTVCSIIRALIFLCCLKASETSHYNYTNYMVEKSNGVAY